MSKTTTSKTNGYIIEITDAVGFKHYPLEGISDLGRTTIERSDSSSTFHRYQIVYLKKASAKRQLNRIRILAEAKGERSTMFDRPVLPIEVAVVPYNPDKP